MMLLTKKNRNDLPELYAQSELGNEAIAHVKFFTPDSNWTWYATEFDGDNKFFGLVEGFETELGYFLLSDLSTATGPGGLKIERDRHFTPKTIGEIRGIDPEPAKIEAGAGEPVRNIDTVDVARILREELKIAFPGTKFSVKSSRYVGGSSIIIQYTDGPKQKDVQAITDQFEGAGFDTMQDMKTYRGAVEYKGEKVDFGVDYIFVKRDVSPETEKTPPKPTQKKAVKKVQQSPQMTLRRKISAIWTILTA